MPGPKSPLGYPETFHKLLATIQTGQPEQIKIASQVNPLRMRALFHQFKYSWQREADRLRRMKDFDAAQRAEDKYNALLKYSCAIYDDGIILTHQATVIDSIEVFGRVITPEDLVKDLKPDEIGSTFQPIIEQQEATAMSVLKLTPKSPGLTGDNPPEPIDPEHSSTKQRRFAFMLANGWEAKDEHELILWEKTGQASPPS